MNNKQEKIEAIEMILEGDTVAAHVREDYGKPLEGDETNYVIGEVVGFVQPGEIAECRYDVECYQIRTMLEVICGKSTFVRSGRLRYFPKNGTKMPMGKMNNRVHSI